jgi:hypothetical protein
MQTSRAFTSHPLSRTIQSMNAPAASGSDCSILIADTFRTPYGSGTGSAITGGRAFSAARYGESGT